jgi:hypothetical protein
VDGLVADKVAVFFCSPTNNKPIHG